MIFSSRRSLQKNERTNSTLLLWNLRLTCFSSFLEEIGDTKMTFQNYLTFRMIRIVTLLLAVVGLIPNCSKVSTLDNKITKTKPNYNIMKTSKKIQRNKNKNQIYLVKHLNTCIKRLSPCAPPSWLLMLLYW